MHNCPNCGSPIDPYKTKCEYCGTYCFDFSNIDFTDRKPVYIKFKTQTGYYDSPIVITALAIPTLETIETSYDYADTYIIGDYIEKVRIGASCEMGVKFNCVIDPEKETLYTVEVNE